MVFLKIIIAADKFETIFNIFITVASIIPRCFCHHIE